MSLTRTVFFVAARSAPSARFYAAAASKPASVSSVTSIGLADENKFFTVDTKETFLINHALSSTSRTEVQSHGAWTMLLRRPIVQSVELLRQAAATKSSMHLTLDGAPGTGKSWALGHLTHFCHQSKWLIFHVPNIDNWLFKSQGMELNTIRKDGSFDQNQDAAAWLTSFQEWNNALLSTLPVKADHAWGAGGSRLPSGSTLKQIIQIGLQDTRLATDAVGALCKEVKALDASQPVLVAIDAVNAFPDAKGNFEKQKLGFLPIEQLNLPKHFRGFALDDSFAPKCGAVVGAVSSCGGAIKLRDMSTKVAQPIETAKLQQGKLTHVHAGLQPYSSAEALAVLQQYKASGWLSLTPSPQEISRLKLLTKLNPRAIHQLCSSL